jgi:hypothetical protein
MTIFDVLNLIVQNVQHQLMDHLLDIVILLKKPIAFLGSI